MEPVARSCLDDDTVMALLDGTASAERVDQIHEHLDECDECRRMVADLARGMGPEASLSKDDLRPGTKLGRYVIDRWLGTGNVGVVYEAHDSLLERKVALKVLRPDAGEAHRGRLLREAKALATLSHPHVIAVYDAGTFGDDIFIAMALADGPTLREWARQKAPPWPRVLEKVVDAARGLGVAHAAGIVHRDVKPDNAMIDEGDRLVVTDFGLARDADAPPTHAGADDSHDDERATVGTLVGTPAYMAPEQLGGGPATAASDQFALCASAYELITGQLPFTGETLARRTEAIARGVLQGRAEAQRTMPTPVLRILERGLSADPDERWGSMDELADALQQARASEQGRASRRRRVVVAMTAGLGLAVLGYAVADSGRSATCGDPAEALGWTAAQARAVSTSIAGSGQAYAEDTARRVGVSLEAYATSWSEAYAAACEGLRAGDAATSEATHTKMACLHRRRHEFTALVAVLAEPDPVIARHALRAVGDLASVDSCDGVGDLRRVAAGASTLDPALEEELNLELAHATALRDSGRYEAGRDAAAAILARVSDLPTSSITVDAQILVADAHGRLGSGAEARDAYHFALQTAEEIGDAQGRARALRGLAFSTGSLLDDTEEGLRWAGLALAAAESTGRDRLVADALTVTAAVHRAREDRERALEFTRRGLALWEGNDHPNRVIGLYNAGTDLRSLLRFDEAQDTLQQAREHGERLLGPEHPVVGAIVGSLGVLEAHRGRNEAALPLLAEGLRIRRRPWAETIRP